MLVPLFLGGDKGVEAYPLRRDSSPVGVGHAVLGVGATVAYFFENHGGAFCRFFGRPAARAPRGSEEIVARAQKIPGLRI